MNPVALYVGGVVLVAGGVVLIAIGQTQTGEVVLAAGLAELGIKAASSQ